MNRQSGFTLLEMMLAVVVMVPLLMVISGMSATVSGTINADDRSSEVIQHARKTVQRLGQFLRPARLSSILVRADADDVALGRATAVGDWISPTDLEPSTGVRFLAAEGLLSMNAALSTPLRQMTFDLEAGELANGVDDDGDGMVDEGRLRFRTDTLDADLGQFESCTFTMDGRILRLSLRGAKPDAQRRVHRASIEQAFHIRNT